MKDYYYILGVSEYATTDSIKEAYKKLSKKFHPDMNEGDKFFEERFKEIQEAYEILSDGNTRKDYDRKRKGNTDPVNSNPRPTDAAPQPSPPKANEVDSNKEFSKFIIGAVLIIGIFSLIYLATKNSNENSFAPIITKPKDICNCDVKIGAQNIEINANSNGEISTYIEFDYDTLRGKIDSIQIKNTTKSKRFDEEVEDVTDSFTNYYRNNRLVGSTYKDPYFTKKMYKSDTITFTDRKIKLIRTYDKLDDEECYFYDEMNHLIKKIHKNNSYDSITFKYEYNGCKNKLSCIKIYNAKGDNISVCNIGYNTINGSVDVATLIKDYRSTSIYNDITKEISTYEVLFDSSCKFKEIRHVYYEYPSGSGHIRQSDNVFTDKGLLLESKDLIMKVENNILPSYYEGNDYSKFDYGSNESFDYQFDTIGNWTSRIRNDGRVIRRKIFYHQFSSHTQ